MLKTLRVKGYVKYEAIILLCPFRRLGAKGSYLTLVRVADRIL